MPAVKMHGKFALDATSNLDLDNEILMIFAQGPDTYFFDSDNNIAYKMHTKYTKDFLEKLLIEIKPIINKELKSMFYGLLSHYYLDAYLHPYIFYRSGNRALFNKYKYMHEYFEEKLDNLYVRGKKLAYLPKFKISREAVNILDKVGSELYDYSLGSSLEKFYNKRRLFHKLFRESFPLSYFFLEIYFINNPYKDKLNKDILNKTNRAWKHPVNARISNKSVTDLYNEGMDEFMKTIKLCEMYFDDKINLQDIKIRKLSYYKGDSAGGMKYFDF